MNKKLLIASLAFFSALLGICASQVEARTALRNICRIKGQEENVLRGLGLVVGLNGTGEAGDPATMRALARAMEVMGSPVPEATLTASGKNELAKIKNV
ncbi:MAG: flagellar basal body P-ring protein FlgI, partial [Lacipirellulaceae bacterium]